MIADKALRGHFIRMHAAALSNTGKTCTNLYTFYRVNTHHGIGNFSVEAIKNRLTQPTGTPVATTVI